MGVPLGMKIFRFKNRANFFCLMNLVNARHSHEFGVRSFAGGGGWLGKIKRMERFESKMGDVAIEISQAGGKTNQVFIEMLG